MRNKTYSILSAEKLTKFINVKKKRSKKLYLKKKRKEKAKPQVQPQRYQTINIYHIIDFSL